LHGSRPWFSNDVFFFFFSFDGQDYHSIFLHDAKGKKQNKRHISFWMTMIKAVYSFAEYGGYATTYMVFETCVSAMERGLLHVDTTNADGWTLGYMFVDNAHIFQNKCLWVFLCFGVLCMGSFALGATDIPALTRVF
jgi:hypothetical protein